MRTTMAPISLTFSWFLPPCAELGEPMLAAGRGRGQCGFPRQKLRPHTPHTRNRSRRYRSLQNCLHSGLWHGRPARDHGRDSRATTFATIDTGSRTQTAPLKCARLQAPRAAILSKNAASSDHQARMADCAGGSAHGKRVNPAANGESKSSHSRSIIRGDEGGRTRDGGTQGCSRGSAGANCC
jgi:hypothetical protein